MVKIDIISGFLGAGKTTFANKLLKHYLSQGKRPAYIVNEFGTTGLDADIIKGDGFEAVEIEGGCVCCTLKDEVSVSIKNVIERFQPTNLVFEPSGIFVFDNFYDILKDDDLVGIFEVQHVFTIVDSVNYKSSKNIYGSFIYNQIKNAEIIILSKLERSRGTVDELVADIRNINSHSVLVSKIWGEWTEDEFSSLLAGTYSRFEHNDHLHSHLKTFSADIDTEFSQLKLDNLVSNVKQNIFGDVYRVKGIIPTSTGNVLLNAALDDVKVEGFKGMGNHRITFIGEQIHSEKVLDFLEN